MSDWFAFFLTALQSIVSKVFELDIGLGFSLGDIEVALLVIGVVAVALVVKSTRLSSSVSLRSESSGVDYYKKS